MHWDRIALGIDDLLGVLLCVRLLRLHLHRVYAIFCAVVLFQLLGTTALVIVYTTRIGIDYRIFWLGITSIGWILLLWLVYTVLGTVLAKLPGVLRFSRRVLNISFAAAALTAALSSGPAVLSLFSPTRKLGDVLNVAFVLDRSVSICALLVQLAVLLFVLWFPVEIPRNLVLFNLGLVLYFLTEIGVMVAPRLLPHVRKEYFSALDIGLMGVCFLYWAATITVRGEQAEIRVGHGWQPAEQQRLIAQLESMNAALLRSARGASQLSAENGAKRGFPS